MRPFAYARPRTVAEAVALLEEHGADARLLAGGTDLLIALRNRWIEPGVVVDLKRIEELQPAIDEQGDTMSITASVVMTDLVEDARVRKYFPSLSEAAAVVGSVQIRNRATLVGNICNCSPAADTAPPLLVHDATVVVTGPSGTRRVPIDDFIVGPKATALAPTELVMAIELPMPAGPYGAAFVRLGRRRGTDLASITLCCGVDPAGVTRLAYGSVGPRPFLVVDDSPVLVDRGAPEQQRDAALERMFADADPSPAYFYRAGPEYRLAMLRVFGRRALATAIERLEGEGAR